MPEHARYVIIGAGPAGTRAAETIRRRDRDGRIIVLSDDPHPFYNRILLSKQFLKDDGIPLESVILKTAEAYAAQAIELWAGARVDRFDLVSRAIDLSRDRRLTYDRCLIASGTRPLRLPVPGADLPGVRYLRSLEDALALRESARGARRAVLVGGGLIGVEVAAALATRGIECTLLAREEWLFGHIAPEAVGRALEKVLRSGGVCLGLGATVGAIERAGEGLVVRTVEGGRFEADLVPAGIGVAPSTGFLSGTGLVSSGGGVTVDECLRSAAPGVYAAGDVAAYADPVVGVRHRVEHWLHAQHTGRRAAENMTGGEAPYARVSYYDTDLFGIPVTVFGAPELATEWIERGDLRDAEGVAYGFRGGRLVGVYRVGETGEPAAIVRLIEEGTSARDLE